jgi:carbon starvation protein CstA
MIRFLILLASVVGAWLVHVVFVTTYMKQFTNTHSAAFRIVYGLELALTFGIMLYLYLSKVHNPARLGLVLATAIGFLAFVDTALWLTQKSVRSNFDVFHFLVAYSVAAIAMTIIYKIKSH